MEIFRYNMPKFYHMSILFIAVACLIASFILTIHEDKAAFVVSKDFIIYPAKCNFKQITKMDCPFCGLSRCFISVSTKKFNRAIYYNKAGIIVYLLFLYQIPYRIYMMYRKETKKDWLSIINVLLIGICTVGLLFNWIYKIITWNFL